MIPGPVKALVLLFPIEAEGEEKRKREDARIATEGQPMLDETIFWVKQTVSCVIFWGGDLLESVTEVDYFL